MVWRRTRINTWRILKIKDLKLDPEPKTNENLKGLGKLAGIKKKLTSHVARHSFAVRCAELGISIETTAQLVGVAVKTFLIYYKVTNRKIDTSNLLLRVNANVDPVRRNLLLFKEKYDITQERLNRRY